MSMSLKIAGHEISIASWLDLNQRIEPIRGAETRRMANGNAFTMVRWQAHRLTLSANGWVLPPLIGIDWSQPVEIEFPKPVTLLAGQSLPAGLTPRSAPWGEFSFVDAGGVEVRKVFFKATVISDGPPLESDNSENPGWELVCEVQNVSA